MELTLGRPSFHAGSSNFMELHAAHEDNIMPKLSKIEAYLKSLEEERRKIEAFKRELPICMQLLSSEIEASREQLCDSKDDETCTMEMSPSHKANFTIAKSPSRKADFTIPRKMNFTFEELNNCETLVGDGHTARLSTSSWPHAEADTAEDQEVVSTQLYRTRTIGSCEEDLQACNNTFGTRPGGAFVPFLKDDKRRSMDAEAAEATSPDHQDVCPNANKLGMLFSASEGATYQQFNESFPPAAVVATNNGICSQPSPHRKPRRCWSAELHRKFVNALKELGGSEVATPKQIRELMQVDGLTNDEVKSHLQKYRLHTKRPNPMSNIQLPAQAPTGTPQLVVLGGIWVPQDYNLKQSLGQSLYMNPVPQLVDQTQKQGQPFFNQEHIHMQQHASSH